MSKKTNLNNKATSTAKAGYGFIVSQEDEDRYYHSQRTTEATYDSYKVKYRGFVALNFLLAGILLASIGLNFFLSSALPHSHLVGMDQMGRTYTLIMHERDQP